MAYDTSLTPNVQRSLFISVGLVFAITIASTYDARSVLLLHGTLSLNHTLRQTNPHTKEQGLLARPISVALNTGKRMSPGPNYSWAVKEAKAFASSRGVDFGSPRAVVEITTGQSGAVIWKFEFDKISVVAKGRLWGKRSRPWDTAKALSDSQLGPRLYWPLQNPADDVEAVKLDRLNNALAVDLVHAQPQQLVITVEEFVRGTAVDQIPENNFLADPIAMTALGVMVAKLHMLPFNWIGAEILQGPLTCYDFGFCPDIAMAALRGSNKRDKMANCLEKNGASIRRMSSFVQVELPVLVSIVLGLVVYLQLVREGSL
jgi:hypothetical protein